MTIEVEVLSWLTFVLRWFHVIAGIAWIGVSFYFIWLDLSLEPPRPERDSKGIRGELWAIHGGGIYEVGKYRTNPTPMPERLHWFKWEAYSTWLSGTALLIVIYYVQSEAYLVGPEQWARTPIVAVASSVVYLFGALAFYELVMRKVARTVPMQLALMVPFVVLLSFLAFETFAARAAMLHVGAALATMMAANVFLVIIPAQKAFVAAIERGEDPPIDRATAAKQRSTQNNYLTLPVLFCMLSTHAAFVYGHPFAWLFVPAFALVAAYARHFFNEKHAGRHRPGILVGSASAFVVLVLLLGIETDAGPSAAADELAPGELTGMVARHCTGCHAETPTQPGYVAPPAGLVFLGADDLLTHRARVVTSLQTQFMPLANLTQMTPDERAALLSFLRAP